MTDPTTPNIILAAFFAAIGACFGSFINAASLRYSLGMSFISGRSCCPACKAVLKWYDLVPLASWLLLGGRCRRCKAKILARYFLAELILAVCFALSFAVFGFNWLTLVAVVLAALLLAISLIDLSTTQIPDGLIIALIPLAVIAIWLQPDVSLFSRIIGFFVISLPMLILALAINNAFGGGDIKLMAVCGFLLGRQNTLLSFFIALLLGGGIAVFLILTKKKNRKDNMVFGPALSAGIFIAMLFGGDIINAYLGLFGF